MTSSCHEAAKMWGTSLLNLGRHHPAWWSLSTEATVSQGARTAITEKCCPGSKTLGNSWKRQQHRREEAAPVGGTQYSPSAALRARRDTTRWLLKQPGRQQCLRGPEG